LVEGKSVCGVHWRFRCCRHTGISWRRAVRYCPPVPTGSGTVMTIRGILFDKDGTLLDYHATWMPLNERVALEAAGGDADRAHALLVAGGLSPDTGRVRSGTVLAAGTNAEIAAFWHPMLGDKAPPLAQL